MEKDWRASAMYTKLAGIILAVMLVAGTFAPAAFSQIRETGKPAMVQQCQKNFDAMDTDKNGVVTREEFLSIEHRGWNAAQVFDARDTNGDKKLTKDEFCAGKEHGGWQK
jgi:hypothetical protein